jgi:hypothetical protein
MSARIRTNKPAVVGETRRNIILPESFDVEIDVISDFLESIGAQGSVSAAIRYALKATAANLKGRTS